MPAGRRGRQTPARSGAGLTSVGGGENDLGFSRPWDGQLCVLVNIAISMTADYDGLYPGLYGRLYVLTSMGLRNTVPSSMALIVPLGLFHICLRLYSLTRSLSGVMVAHFTPTR